MQASFTPDDANSYDRRPKKFHDWMTAIAIHRDHKDTRQNLHERKNASRQIEGAEPLPMPEDDTINVDSPVTNTHYHQDKSSALGPLLAALLGAAIPGAGVVGYLLNQTETPAVQQSTDETVEIGLGRIEDYPKPSE